MRSGYDRGAATFDVGDTGDAQVVLEGQGT